MVWPPHNLYLDFRYCATPNWLHLYQRTRGYAYLYCYFSIYGPADFKFWADRRGIAHEDRNVLVYNVWSKVRQLENRYSQTHTFKVDLTAYRGGLWVLFTGMWWSPGWPGHSPIHETLFPAPYWYDLLDTETWTALE